MREENHKPGWFDKNGGSVTDMHKKEEDIYSDTTDTCNGPLCFDNTGTVPFPSRKAVIQIILQARRIIFPGYFSGLRFDDDHMEEYIGTEICELSERLSGQTVLAFQHDCLKSGKSCSECIERSNAATASFMGTMRKLKSILATDVHAAFEGDPAAKSLGEIIFSYPGLFAITVYRIAHELYDLDIPLLPRMMTEYAHSVTGIDIHPGAQIGESFFIDHGTGVVIGETTEIGSRVRLYQGVTLGALSLPRDDIDRFRNRKRHPTIEDDVIIYSNATLLGGEIVVGARSIIGGNVWITESVPPDTKVLLKPPELIYIGNGLSKKRKAKESKDVTHTA